MRNYVDTEMIIGNAIMNPEKQQESMDKMTIHTIVCHIIFCPNCETVMDSKKAVLVEISHKDLPVKDHVFCGFDCASRSVEQVRGRLEKNGCAIRIVAPWTKAKPKAKKSFVDKMANKLKKERDSKAKKEQQAIEKARLMNPDFIDPSTGNERLVEIRVESKGKLVGRFHGKASMAVPEARKLAKYFAKRNKSVCHIVSACGRFNGAEEK